jgi:hypothetical protein
MWFGRSYFREKTGNTVDKSRWNQAVGDLIRFGNTASDCSFTTDNNIFCGLNRSGGFTRHRITWSSLSLDIEEQITLDWQ